MSTIAKNNQSNFDAAIFGLALDATGPVPLYAQLTDVLRRLILSQGRTAGLRLPSSRALADDLSVSRMTVTAAYEQLLGEGYLVSRRGSGTYVADQLPHLATPAPTPVASAAQVRAFLPFRPGVPDMSLFPHRVWARHLERAWRSPAAALLAEQDVFGWRPLREAIARHLSVWRNLECDPGQIVITGGAAEAIEVVCAVALTAGARAAVEDPGWAPLSALLPRCAVTAFPQRIDDQGLDAASLPDGVAAVFVTPSRHYPTGRVMPLPRRLALLAWAAAQGALVVEDDYDSEFRYRGQPLPALAGLDQLRHTAYIGSFSKLLSSSLRIGYLVLPEPFVGAARAHLSKAGPRASLVPQPALADFMDSGDFALHLRRMRRVYGRRQAHLVRALESVSDMLEVAPDPAGMHLCCALRPALSERAGDGAIAALARERGLDVRALSAHSVLPDPPQGLLLGYTAFDEDSLSDAARCLGDVIYDLLGA